MYFTMKFYGVFSFFEILVIYLNEFQTVSCVRHQSRLPQNKGTTKSPLNFHLPAVPHQRLYSGNTSRAPGLIGESGQIDSDGDGDSEDVIESLEIYFKVTGGVVAVPHEYPSIVSVQTGKKCPGNLSTCEHKCGGVIINSEWIVSASHCYYHMPNAKYTVEAGRHKIFAEEPDTRQTRRVDTIILHELYDPGTQRNDIALLHLAKPLKLNYKVQPVQLPHKGYRVNSGPLVVAGWGFESFSGVVQNALLKAELGFIDDATCHMMYSGQQLFKSELCAGYKEGGKDSCPGGQPFTDSGGPLYKITTNGTQVLVGIVSFGIGCGNPNAPGVYTEVAYYVDWIKKSTRVTSSKCACRKSKRSK